MLVNSLQPNFSQTVTNWVFFSFFMVHLRCRALNLYSTAAEDHFGHIRSDLRKQFVDLS